MRSALLGTQQESNGLLEAHHMAYVPITPGQHSLGHGLHAPASHYPSVLHCNS